MTRAGATLADIPARLPWTALRSFVTHLDAASAVYAELHPEMAAWASPMGAKEVLAGLYDLVSAFMYAFQCANTPKGKRRPPKPRRYPRPGVDDGRRKIGSDPIPIRDFDEWWNGG